MGVGDRIQTGGDMTGNDLNLAALRRQLSARRLVDSNIHNLAKSMFKPGSNVQITVSGRQHYGQVVEVVGLPGATKVRVQIGAKKPRDICLEDVTGMVEGI